MGLNNVTHYFPRKFVGRGEEKRVVIRELDSALSGRTRVVLLGGEPGIGKTRLSSETASWARDRNFRVLWGGCTEAEGMPPYLPFLEALGSHIKQADPVLLKSQVNLYGPVLVELLPELGPKLGNLPETYSLPTAQARLRLYEAIGSFITALSAEQPLLLVLDDLHWADRATLEMLTHFVTHQAAARCMVLGAFRQEEKAANPPFEKAILELTRARLLTVLPLGPLSEIEIGMLAIDAANQPRLEPAVRRQLYRQSEGNPFFAEELMLAWNAVDDLAPGQPEMLYKPKTSSLVPTLFSSNENSKALPASLVMLIRQRLDHLPVETRQFLRTAAIIGRHFGLSLLAETSGESLELVEEKLEEARQAGIIRVTGKSEEYVFSHDKFREVLYDEVTAFRRRRLHGFIGRAIQQTVTGPASEPAGTPRDLAIPLNGLADLSYHFSNSGDIHQGAHYAELAGHKAFRTYAFETAQEQYLGALSLLPPEDQRKADLNLLLGEAALLAGNEKVAVKAFEDASRSFLEQVPVDAEKLGRAFYGSGRAYIRLEQFPQAQAALEEALARLEAPASGGEGIGLSGSLPALVIDLEAELGNFLVVNLSNFEEGLTHINKALQLSRQAGLTRQEVVALRTSGNLRVRTGQINEALPLLEEALQKVRKLDHPAEGAECCSTLFGAYMWTGQMTLAEQMLRERVEFALRCQEPYQLRHVYSLLGFLLFLRGELEESAYWINLASEVVQQLTDPEPLAFLQQSQSAIAFFRGDYQRAVNSLEEALVVFRQMGPGVTIWYLAPLSLFQSYLGKEVEALQTMSEVEEYMAALPRESMPVLDAASILAEFVLLKGDKAKIKSYHSLLLPAEGRFINFSIDRLLAEFEIELGDYEAAENHLRSARLQANRENIIIEISACLTVEARLLLAKNKPVSADKVIKEKAFGLANEALELARRYDLAGWVRHLEKRLVGIVQPGNHKLAATQSEPSSFQPVPIAPKVLPTPNGLSPRELEVLRLVAQGKSNFEIAEELSITEKTAGNHLSSIFNKTGLPNRAAAAVWAIRQNLV